MAPQTRRYFEARLGHDFSKVRIHRGAQAHRAADAVNARAFSLGNDVILGNGVPGEQHVNGRATLAHELTHVAQRHSGIASSTPSQLLRAEAEAHTAAETVAHGGTAALRQRVAPHHLLREPKTGAGLPTSVAGNLTLPLEGVKKHKVSSGFTTYHSYELFGFETNSDKLTGDHLLALASIAREWKDSSLPPKVYIEGGADKIGAEAKNLTLGQRRADAVGKALAAMLNVPLAADLFLLTFSAGEPEKGPTEPDASLRKVSILFKTFDLDLGQVPSPDGPDSKSPTDQKDKTKDGEKTDASPSKSSGKEEKGDGKFKLRAGLDLGVKEQTEKDKDTGEKTHTLELTRGLELELKRKLGKDFSVKVIYRHETADTVGGDSKIKGRSTESGKVKFTWEAISTEHHQLSTSVMGSGEISFVRKEDASGELKTEPKGKGKILGEVSYRYKATKWLELGASLQGGVGFTKDGAKPQLHFGAGVHFPLRKNLDLSLQTMPSLLPGGDRFFITGGVGLQWKFDETKLFRK